MFFHFSVPVEFEKPCLVGFEMNEIKCGSEGRGGVCSSTIHQLSVANEKV